MGYQKVEGSWSDLKREIKTQFNKLSDTDIEGVRENLDALSGIVQKVYGYTMDEATAKVRSFRTSAAQYIDQVAAKVAPVASTGGINPSKNTATTTTTSPTNTSSARAPNPTTAKH